MYYPYQDFGMEEPRNEGEKSNNPSCGNKRIKTLISLSILSIDVMENERDQFEAQKLCLHNALL